MITRNLVVGLGLVGIGSVLVLMGCRTAIAQQYWPHCNMTSQVCVAYDCFPLSGNCPPEQGGWPITHLRVVSFLIPTCGWSPMQEQCNPEQFLACTTSRFKQESSGYPPCYGGDLRCFEDTWVTGCNGSFIF